MAETGYEAVGRSDTTVLQHSRDVSHNGLCEDCAKVDLNQGLNPASEKADGHPMIYRLQRHQNLKPVLNCKLHQFLEKELLQYLAINNIQFRYPNILENISSLELYAEPSQALFSPTGTDRECDPTIGFRVRAAGSKLLTLVRGNRNIVTWVLPCADNKETASRGVHGCVIQNTRIDWTIPKKWLEVCHKHHGKICGELEFELPAGFSVIDCESRRIIPASFGLEYAALSYVWGPATETILCHKQLPEATPQVIEDAVKATISLGLKYLWVDRYCIDHTNSSEKHNVINSMGEIYKHAAITLIDAVGEEPTHGLSGISKDFKNRQNSLVVGGKTFVSVPALKKEVETSKWSSRGWTYQEGLLSRRRLVFTSSQLYFQCMRMHCCESVSTPKQLFQRQFDVNKSFDEIGFRVFPYNSIGTDGEIQDRINDYLKRQLSFESDLLNAYLGILQETRKTIEHISHFWGLPLNRPTAELTWQQSLPTALLWEPYPYRPGHQRTKFPSWSWIGWKSISPIALRPEIYAVNTGLSPEVHLQMLDGSIMGVDEYVSRGYDADSGVTLFRPLIYLTGWVAMVKLVKWERASQGHKLCFGLYGGRKPAHDIPAMYTILARSLLVDMDLSQFHSRWWPMLLMTTKNRLLKESNASFKGLLMKPIENGFCERLGVVQCNDQWDMEILSQTEGLFFSQDGTTESLLLERRTITLV